MNEILSVTPERDVLLQELCGEVGGLYPGIAKIQSFCGTDRRVSFWVICNTDSLAEEDFGEIQQTILGKLIPKIPGYKCALSSIRQIMVGDIIDQNDVGITYMREVCGSVEEELGRENIRLTYENGVLIVCKLKPCADNLSIINVTRSKIPENCPYNIDIRSYEEERDKSVATVADGTSASCAEIKAPSGLSVFSGVALLWSRLVGIAKRNTLPPE